MKIKLYIDGLYPIPNTLCEESIYTLGKIDNDVIKNSVAFKDISQEDILEHVEYTDIDNCDYILYPYKIEPYANIDNLISLSEEYNKKILLFYNDDNDRIFNFPNSILFRTSLYKSNKPDNYLSLPTLITDLKNEVDNFQYRKKDILPTVGFCGVISHSLRNDVLTHVYKSNIYGKIKSNFIIRKDFWGGDVWGENVRRDYVNNMHNSDFILCMRGAGNFSYRFYESLCMGKIPVFCDTDCDLPFSDEIDYKSYFPIVNHIPDIIDNINDFWKSIDDYELHQKKLIKLWEDYLSPIGFVRKTNEFLLKNK